MHAQGVDLLAVAPSDDLRYLLGFSPTADERPCMLLVGGERELFVVPALNAEQTAGRGPRRRALDLGRRGRCRDDALAAAVGALGRPRRGPPSTRRCARTSCSSCGASSCDAELTTAESVVGELRLRKDADEFELLQVLGPRRQFTAMQGRVRRLRRRASRELDVAEGQRRYSSGVRVSRTSLAHEHRVGPERRVPAPPLGGRARSSAGDGVTIDIGGSPRRLPVRHHPDGARRRAVGSGIWRCTGLSSARCRRALAAVRPGATCGSGSNKAAARL